MSASTSYTIDSSLLELFKIEVENHTRSLETGLVALEDSRTPDRIEPLMRAAHSIKGASRIVGLDIAVGLAHAMEDVLSAAQHGKYIIDSSDIDLLLKGNDIFIEAVNCDVNEIATRLQAMEIEIQNATAEISTIMTIPKEEKDKKKYDKQNAPKETTKIETEELKQENNEFSPQKTEDKKATSLADFSLMELFIQEVSANSSIIEIGLLQLDRGQNKETLEPLMRAAHSIKGAAKIVGLEIAVRLASEIENIFSCALKGNYKLDESDEEVLLRANDVFSGIAQLEPEDISDVLDEEASIIDSFCREIENLHLLKEARSSESEYDDISDPQPEKLESFIDELKAQNEIIQKNIVRIEKDIVPAKILPLWRAIRTVREAARIAGIVDAVELARAMEKTIRIADDGLIHLEKDQIDLLKKYAEFFQSIVGENALDTLSGIHSQTEGITQICSRIKHFLGGKKQSSSQDEKPSVTEKIVPEQKKTKKTLGLFTSGRTSALPEKSKITTSVQNENTSDKPRTNPDIEDNKPSSHKTAIPKKQEQKELETESAQERQIFQKEEDTSAITSKTEERSITQSSLKEPDQEICRKSNPAITRETAPKQDKSEDSFVRVLSDNLNRLLGLTGECLVQAKSTKHFSTNLLRIKKLLMEIDNFKETIYQNLKEDGLSDEIRDKFLQSSDKLDMMGDLIVKVIEHFEMFSRRLEYTAERLYSEAIATRMKPFSEGLHGFPRLVRDVSKKLNKKVNLIIKGESTRVDRDILEKLESPLNHLLRNAIDHGFETPEERESLGKNPEGTLIIEARHSFGMLIVSVKDDGKGIDTENLRRKIVEKGYTSEEMASAMSNNELIEFLFLPGFSTAKQVTEISGRGVGLDVVFSMVHEVGGALRADSTKGAGTTFQLQLPLTLSVLRTLLMEINGEAYAIPLSRLDRISVISQNDIRIIEDRQYCVYDNDNIGILDAYQLFRLPGKLKSEDIYHIVVLSDRLNRYGLAVDKFLGERDLVVVPLDGRLGDIPNISAGAILEDGAPVLILDVDDMVRSIDNILSKDKVKRIGSEHKKDRKKKHILVVDDSLTVREVERKLLENKGYSVTVAVDGIDGWNILHQNITFDMVISDIDMPRMNGIELVRKIKNETRFRDLPVMIVSYKDREEDRRLGLDAGANYYLTKSSFHDATLLNAVGDLIGEP